VYVFRKSVLGRYKCIASCFEKNCTVCACLTVDNFGRWSPFSFCSPWESSCYPIWVRRVILSVWHIKCEFLENLKTQLNLNFFKCEGMSICYWVRESYTLMADFCTCRLMKCSFSLFKYWRQWWLSKSPFPYFRTNCCFWHLSVVANSITLAKCELRVHNK
jgi:hypothetical protein